MSDWIGIIIAALAFLLSGYTWFVQNRQQRFAGRQADVTVAFHWLPVRAHVSIAGHGEFDAGYHLVIWNRGPAKARNIDLELTDGHGTRIRLLDLAPDELPLASLDAHGRYPIPWVIDPFVKHARRFDARITWLDESGQHERVIPLRRGQLPS